MPKPTVDVLDNGVRVLCEPMEGVNSVFVGLWLAAGSRNELQDEGGMTHFAEHLLFKGTGRRHWRDISRAMNLLGGQFNAATSTDWVKAYARVVKRDLSEALGLLTDMFLGSEFPEQEVERERQVILEEIAMYEDIPEDLCFERFTQALLLPHPAGRPILGTPEAVSVYTRERLLDYWREHVLPGRLVLSAAGAVERDDLLALAERLLGGLNGGGGADLPGGEPIEGNHKRVLVERDLEQVNFCLGVTGPRPDPEAKLAWPIYDTILGGGMGSRLFDEVREKRGLAYSVGSSLQLVKEGGYLQVSGSTRPEYAATAIEVCREQMQDLAERGPGREEFDTARSLLERGHLLAMEQPGVRASMNAERLLFGVPHLDTEEVLERLRRAAAEDVQEVARAVVDFGAPAGCLVGPLKGAVGLEEVFPPTAHAV